MKQCFWIFLTLVGLELYGQQITFDTQKTFQTMHSFGASDCWSMAMIGKYYPESKKKQIAEWLFSQDSDPQGNPKGIGLSMWRFNIGAGSTEQGKSSKITNEWRRSESFLNSEGYDWEKQKGQQYFLAAAKQYQVPYTLGFLNSSPIQMTKNGLAIGSGRLGEWNFDSTKIDAWTNFITKVSQHFNFNYISPFNEPQWDWGPNKSGEASQEGTPITNSDIAWATKKLAEHFQRTNAKTRIVIPEAGQLNYLYDPKSNRPGQDGQIENFFQLESPNYVGNLSTVERVISGHSYFTTSPSSKLVSTRQELHKKAKAANIDFWQSEYCILGDNAGEITGNGVDLGMKTALYVAKVIHSDLNDGNASSWSWWLAVSANDYKDGLIYTFNGTHKGENDHNKFDADLYDSKTLWALGNYARFVRPGMKRIEASIQQPDCLITGFTDQKSIVLVLINSGNAFELHLGSKQEMKTYTTSATQNLSYHSVQNNRLPIPASSIMTIIFDSKFGTAF
ncbi:glycoside hydrolase [Aquirufa lenticrescens]|uniref:glycoside hydrolase n=1 Tax=Aquirufa lenticrescens TaxID=2696560 RepID=UPI001CAA5FD1|nr:glycoside hydrolase [Aquirufa lenticrescens]UAJ13572.1 glycoside hydrolase [Aquirufa lenticrescens]